MGTRSTARPEERRRAFVKRERELARMADRQHGVISKKQLLDAGLGLRTITRRVESGRLRSLHRGVYAFGGGQVEQRGLWMAAVLACGEDALLSHRSAAALWGLMRPSRPPVDISAASGRGRPGIAVHEGGIFTADRAVVARIPVTSVARTLLDLAEVVDEQQLEKAFEEAGRLRLLEMRVLEGVCARGHGRRGLKPIRRLIDAARMPETTRSVLESRVLTLCRNYELPQPVTNVAVMGHEVDAFWPSERLIVEADGFAYHGHRAAFERDRERDAAMQAAGYRVIRLTHRRLENEPAEIAAQIRRILHLGSRRAGT